MWLFITPLSLRYFYVINFAAWSKKLNLLIHSQVCSMKDIFNRIYMCRCLRTHTRMHTHTHIYYTFLDPEWRIYHTITLTFVRVKLVVGWTLALSATATLVRIELEVWGAITFFICTFAAPGIPTHKDLHNYSICKDHCRDLREHRNRPCDQKDHFGIIMILAILGIFIGVFVIIESCPCDHLWALGILRTVFVMIIGVLWS